MGSDQGVGLVSQQAWIQQGTLKDNILMGKPYEWTRYNTAVEASALSDDIKVNLFIILLHHKLFSAALSNQCEIVSSMILLYVSPKRLHFSSFA